MKKVLVIDDCECIADLIQEALCQEGYLVDVAVDGKEGLTKYFEGEYDLVITDMKMPGCNGLAVSERIKRSNRPTLLIGISGTPWIAPEKSFDAVIQKPFSLYTLFDHVQRLAGKDNNELAVTA